MRIAVRAFERTAARAGHELSIPFRDHTSWKTYWLQRGASGSWQAGESCSASSLTGPTRCSSPPRTGRWSRPWPKVSHRGIAWGGQRSTSRSVSHDVTSALPTTPQDYRAAGNNCVHLTEALSRRVYDHATLGDPGEDEPPVPKTKLRLERYIEAKLPGAEHTELRKFARSTIEPAQAVKHSGTPTRTEAGILADAVILPEPTRPSPQCPRLTSVCSACRLRCGIGLVRMRMSSSPSARSIRCGCVGLPLRRPRPH